MKKQLFIACLSVLVAFSAVFAEEATSAKAATNKNEESKKNIILIVVNGTAIYKSDVTDGLNYSIRMNKNISKEDFSKTLSTVEDYLVDITLVNNAANEKGTTVSEEEFNTEYQNMIIKFNMTEEKFLESLKEKGLDKEKFIKNAFRPKGQI